MVNRLKLILLLGIIFFPPDAYAQYERIISLSPNITEILFALGAGDKIIAVTDYCDYPPEARSKMRIGSIMNINFETIVSLKPDLIILLPSYRGFKEKLETFKIEYLTVENNYIKDIIRSIRIIGGKLRLQKTADNLADSLQNDLNDIAEKAKKYPAIKTLLIVGKTHGTLQSIDIAGKSTFLYELINLAAGENMPGLDLLPYPRISKEEIIAFNPEYILDLSYYKEISAEDIKKEKKAWRSLPFIKAVKNDNIVFITDISVSIPGPRIVKTAEKIFNIIHSEKN